MSNLTDLNLNVDEESKGMNDFSRLPDGEYTVVMTKSETKENKSGKGMHLSATLEVIEGEAAGRLIFINFNVQNQNPVAERIGRAELAACCKAVGKTNPADSEELHDIPFKIKLGTDRKDPTQNQIKAYMPAEAAAKPAPAAAAKPAAPKAPAPASAKTAGSKPWQRK